MFEIILNLPFADLSALSRTDQRFASLFCDDYFWRQKAQRDFPHLVPTLELKNIELYISTDYRSRLERANHDSYFTIKKRLEDAIKTGNIRLVSILTPLRYRYYSIKYEIFSTNKFYFTDLAQMAVKSNRFAILVYLLEQLKAVNGVKKFRNTYGLWIEDAKSSHNLEMIQSIVAYYESFDPHIVFGRHFAQCSDN